MERFSKYISKLDPKLISESSLFEIVKMTCDIIQPNFKLPDISLKKSPNILLLIPINETDFENSKIYNILSLNVEVNQYLIANLWKIIKGDNNYSELKLQSFELNQNSALELFDSFENIYNDLLKEK